MGNGGNAIFPPLKGGKMGNGKWMGNGGKCFRSSQQAKMEWKYNDKWVDYLSVLESAIPILLSSVTRLRSLGVTVGVAAPRKWQVTWKERVQMKEGESTGNGSCGDSTAAAGAADRCTSEEIESTGIRRGRRRRRQTGAPEASAPELRQWRRRWDQRRMIERWVKIKGNLNDFWPQSCSLIGLSQQTTTRLASWCTWYMEPRFNVRSPCEGRSPGNASWKTEVSLLPYTGWR